MMLMAGWDRTYPQVGGGDPVTAWDLLDMRTAWATRIGDAVVTGLVASATAALDDCVECEDSGLYGVEPAPDELTALVRVRDRMPEVLQADGSWAPYAEVMPSVVVPEMRYLTRELAVDLAEAILAGASRLVLRPVMPRAFLPPSPCQPVLAAVDLTKEPAAPPDGAAPTGADAAIGDGWNYYVVVDELDTGAVLDLFRLKPGPELERYDGTGWVPDPALLSDLQGVTPPPIVEITDPAQFADVYQQVQASYATPPGKGGVTAAVEDNLPPHPKCKYCKQPATQRILHSEGMAYIPVCGDHLAKGRDDAAHCTPDGTRDPSNINWIHPTKAAALLADAPLTVSPNPNAEKLRRYWSTGEGGAKIRWGTHGDWRRCVKYLGKYLGTRAKGYCQNMHKRNTGVWTGSKLNASAAPPELQLLSSIRTGTWIPEDGKATDMLADGIYAERIQDVLVASLLAGGFPVEPPPEWFTDPKLASATPITVDDKGRVYGHLADWETAHIGLPGSTHAPRSRSDYAFFKTGVLRTAGGGDVNVGQLTLVGGHAPLAADAATAVKHYDDTASAVADVAIGEDRHGIWVAGAMRPEVTPVQLRAFRASALSGDWRPIKGSLELVAACAVNVPGFPIARARVAGGQVLAMVAAGSRQLYVKQLSLAADAAMAERVGALERLLADAGIGVPEGATVSTTPAMPPAVVTDTADIAKLTPLDAGEEPPEEQAAATRERVRTRVKEIKRTRLRERVHHQSMAASGGGATPGFPDGLAHDVRQAIRDRVHGVTAGADAKHERKGIGGYPIKSVQALKKAISAYGRSKPADRAATRAHIISEAKRLKHTELIPDAWLASAVMASAVDRAVMRARVHGTLTAGAMPTGRQQLRDRVHGGETELTAAAAASDGTYQEKDHPRGINGTWIEKGGDVDYVDPATGETRRAMIVGFDRDGNVILHFKDDPGVLVTIPRDDVGNVIEGAPQPVGRLDGKGKGSGGGGGGAAKGKGSGGGGGGAAKAKSGGKGGGSGGTPAANKAATELVLPSAIKPGSQVEINGSPTRWTVAKFYVQGNGTYAVDLKGPRGEVENGFPISGPKGVRKTGTQLGLTPITSSGLDRQSIRDRVHGALAASGRQLLRDRVHGLTAGVGKYLEWQHPRGIGGKWIQKLGAVDILDQHGGGKGKRGKIKDLTEKGPVVQYPDGKVETIPLKDAATRIRVAPTTRGKLNAPGAPNAPKTPSAPNVPAAPKTPNAPATPKTPNAPATPNARVDKSGNPLPTVERDASGKIIVSDEAKRLGSDVYNRAVAAEPEISASLAGMVGDRDPTHYSEPSAGEGKLYGFEHRLKKEAGIQEKVERNVEEDKLQRPAAAENIKDAVRYTVHFPQDEFGTKVQDVIDQLTAENAKVVVKNTWPPEAGRAYKGVNVNVWRNDGTAYEVQFHTPESQRVKDQMHGLYEDQRKTVHGSSQWQAIEDQMRQLGDTLVRENPPAGVMTIRGRPAPSGGEGLFDQPAAA